MKLIETHGNSEIWAVKSPWGLEYYVYGYYTSGDPKVCPSLEMARAYAA